MSDPKNNPQPGDAVTPFNGRTRTVTKRDRNNVWYKLDGRQNEHKCWLGQWLEWCQQHVP